MNEKFLSVLVPMYNEESTISSVINKLLELNMVKEIIVVDDGSKDKSYEIVEKLSQQQPLIRLFKMPKNSGKTAAINYAFKKITGSIAIIQDADLEYSPDDIPQVISPIQKGFADVSYGSRFLVKKETRILYFYHYAANKFLTLLSNLFTNLNMSDVETGYKAFKAEIVKNLELQSSGYGMEIELTAIIAKIKARVYEVPISYYGRTYEEGKKITFWDGLAAIYYIFYYNLKPLKKDYRNYILKRLELSNIEDSSPISIS